MHDVFFFTDIHGMYDLYRAIMDYCHKQDPEAMIIFGGDACDRGPDGYRIMQELIANPYVCYLKGNHEDMFVKAARMLEHDSFLLNETDKNIIDFLQAKSYGDDLAMCDCLYNGGLPTLMSWIKDGMPISFINEIDRLPLTFSYNNFDFCHSGGYYKTFVDVAEKEYYGQPISEQFANYILWDRDFLDWGWKEDRICVFGHTPTTYLPAKIYGKDKSLENVHPCKYYAKSNVWSGDVWSGMKIDMDTGAAFLGTAYVLNCLTMKATGFKDHNFKDKNTVHNVEQFEVIQL